MLEPGSVLQNRYRVLELLGHGGMGAVYRAWDIRLKVAVALKQMTSQPGLDPAILGQLRQQFRQEATIVARLRHPSLVSVTDFFEEGDNVYLVMTFIEGETLAERIERQGMLPERDVLNWADQLLSALAYCHSQGVVHRDVKPQNVVIRPDGQAVLVDFGLVKLWNPGDPRTRTVMRGMGTPEYAPPEQYDTAAGHTGPHSDIYSLGAALYHALTGQAPPTATMRIVTPAALVPLRERAPQVSPRTEMAIMRALELQPAGRFQNTKAMTAALSGGPPAPPSSSPRARAAPRARPMTAPAKPSAPVKRTVLWIGAGIAAAVVIVGLCVGVALGTSLLPWSFRSSEEHTAVPPTVTLMPTDTRVSPAPTESPATQVPQTPTLSPTPTVRPSPTPEPTVEPTIELVLEWTTIGESVQGRNLELAVVGNPNGAAVVVVGSIQGDQPTTRDLVYSLIDDFGRDRDMIPPNMAFHFIPSINPDGNVAGTRRNANDVDLNRNWETFDWTADPEQPGGVVRGAGGRRPLSEPETQALAQHLLSLWRRSSGVRLVVWHATRQLSSSGQVYPGYTTVGLEDESVRLAVAYANVAGYEVKEDWVAYETTGELIAWCAEEGVPAVDVVIPRSVAGTDRNLRQRTIRALLEVARFP